MILLRHLQPLRRQQHRRHGRLLSLKAVKTFSTAIQAEMEVLAALQMLLRPSTMPQW